MGTGSFPGVKRPGRGVDHPPDLAPRLKKDYSYMGFRGLFYSGLYLYLYLYLYLQTFIQTLTTAQHT